MKQDISKNVLISGIQFAGQKKYWLGQLSGEPAVSGFPHDHDHAGSGREEKNKRASLSFHFPGPIYNKLMHIGNASAHGIFILLLTGLYYLLFRYTGNEDIIIGAPVFKQDGTGTYINTLLALRSPVNGTMTFKDLLLAVKKTVTEANEHMNYPLGEILKLLEMPVQEETFTLFNTMVIFENIHDKQVVGNEIHKYETVFFFRMTGKGLEGEIDYAGALYNRNTFERLSRYLTAYFDSVTRNPAIKLHDIDILSPGEKKRLLYDFNATRRDYPKDKTIPAVFEERAKKFPAKIALVGWNGKKVSISYKELNEKAGGLSVRLRGKGVRQGDIVGFKLPRSLEMVVAVLGIMKAGAACLPLNIDYPEERIDEMLEDSKAVILLTTDDQKKGRKDAKTQRNIKNFYNNTPLRLRVFVANFSFRKGDGQTKTLAYVIYTSGSTGKPKGVMLSHAGIINHVFTKTDLLAAGSKDIFCHNLSISFVASIWQFFAPLFLGAKLVVYPGEIIIDPYNLFLSVENDGVTLLEVVPSLLNAYLQLLETGGQRVPLNGLRAAVLTGEKILPALVNKFYKTYNIELINAYGQSECSDDTLHYRIPYNTGTAVVPVGKPANNTHVYVLDRGRRLQPPGVPGELYIGGDGLAAGYLNRVELTAETFPANPFMPGTAVYRTGDYVRLMVEDNGNMNIEFLGRIDHQVKIRGFRIELSEIENCLLKHKEIDEAVVMAPEDKKGEKYLCAYIAAGVQPSPAQLRDYLAKKLPAYMIPSSFITVEKIPLTASGKVNRQALSQFQISDFQSRNAPTPPRDAIEDKLAGIWSEVLEIEKKRIGVEDNFFDIGGHSLKATILVSRVLKEFDAVLPLREVFNRSTIRALGDFIKNAGENLYEEIKPAAEKEYYPQSSAQKRLFFLDRFEEIGTTYNMPSAFTVQGRPDKERFERVFNVLIQRHETLRTSFHLIDEEPVQKIHPMEEIQFAIEHENLATEDTGDTERKPDKKVSNNKKFLRGAGAVFIKRAPARRRQKISAFIRPFKLSQAPLLRVGIFSISKTEHILLFDMHHIISDGTSKGILADEFKKIYDGEELLPFRIQYKDFSQWQNNLVKSGKIEEQREYWLNLFSDAGIPRLDLPLDYPRPVVMSFQGDRYSFKTGTEESVTFREQASRQGATLYMNLAAAFNVLLYKYTGQGDIVLGSGIAGRHHADLENLIGMFVNNLLMRNRPAGDKTYRDFLKEVKENSLKAFENQDVQFEELVDKLQPARDPSRNPVFDVSIVLQNYRQPEVRVKDAGFTFAHYPMENKIAKFDMTLYIQEAGDEIYFTLEYCTKLFKQETIQRLAGHFLNILKGVHKNPDLRLSEIDMLDEEEKGRLLDDFNRTFADYPRDKCIHELFAGQVEKTPDRIAVVGAGCMAARCALTFGELDKRAGRAARFLYHEKGVCADVPVGILMDKSVERITAILGVLKAGGAYVPLAPSLPEERVKGIIDDAGIGTLISGKRHIRTLNRLQWACDSFHSFLCLDTENIYEEKESETNELMEESLWRHVGESAVDEISAGGWLSSYTGESIPKKEMDEYAANVLEKLKPLLHKNMRVLEIGCASGITMYRLAPEVGFYYGIDLSPVIIEKNREKIVKEGHRNIALTPLPAHQADQLAENNFDLVIINSVTQCFHGHNYLRKVIDKSIACLNNHKGHLFIGDVMDQDLKDALTREMREFKRSHRDKNYKTKTGFSTELFAARGFFEDLAQENPWIAGVEFSNKIHTIENELTKFRYDVLIAVDKTQKKKKRKNNQKNKYQQDLTALGAYRKEKPVPRGNLNPGNLAYIIYTSGTAGKPKGVTVEHRPLVNLCSWHNRFFAVTEKDNATHYAGFGFDASVWEIFPYLIKGASLHIIADEIQLDTAKLRAYYESNHITISFLPTQMCEQMMALEEEMPSLRALLTGGDKLRTFTPRHYQLYNNYGPTENTVVAASCKVERYENNIPIGRPIDNNRIYILDRGGLQVQPVGVGGELCIAGDSLARGYLNTPELTAEKFCLRRQGALFEKTAPGPRKNFLLKQKFFGGSRGAIFQKSPPGRRRPRGAGSLLKIYKTGDLARWLWNGNIEFLGRIDHQIKIRGYRIELGEIENRLLEHECVNEVVVISAADPGGGRTICAYIVSAGADTAVEGGELKDYLARGLPHYMIPSYFILLDKIPLTSAGKIDRKALLESKPGDSDRRGKSEYQAPGNEIEEILQKIWSEVLGTREIGTGDNFFEIGGDSIKAIQVSARLKKHRLKVDVSQLFLNQTIEALAKCTARIDRLIPQETVVGEVPLTPIQRWFFKGRFTGSHHFNQAVMIYRKEGFDEGMVKKVFEKITLHHDALRMVYEVKGNQTIQVNRGTGGNLFHLEVKDFKEEENIESKIEKETGRIQGAIDLSRGPLVRLGLFKTPKGDHLLMVIHHLVIDGVSWRILFEDFAAGYGHALAGKEIQFQDKTDSFKTWSEKLTRYAGGSGIQEESGYWREVENRDTDPLPTDYKIGMELRKNKYTERVSMTLNEEETGQLSKEVNRAYGTEINDILLTALMRAVREWGGVKRTALILEGHGREAIMKDVDINRTIGWFTSQFPVVLAADDHEDLSREIKTIKEQLRRIPNKGIGYGILKYLTPEEKKPGFVFRLNPPVSFNYLGEIGQEGGGDDNNIFTASPLGAGQTMGPELEKKHTLEIDGLTIGGRLILNFIYNKHEYRKSTIEKLVDCYKANLIEIIDHCTKKKEKEITPSDLIDSEKLSLEELEDIDEFLSLNIED